MHRQLIVTREDSASQLKLYRREQYPFKIIPVLLLEYDAALMVAHLKKLANTRENDLVLSRLEVSLISNVVKVRTPELAL